MDFIFHRVFAVPGKDPEDGSTEFGTSFSRGSDCLQTVNPDLTSSLPNPIGGSNK